MNRYSISLSFICLFISLFSKSQENINRNKFRQLKYELATPNVYRNAAGAPGHKYYQQKANYVIEVELDDENQVIRGKETVTYINNSPDELTYLWLQLDQNMRAKDSDTKKIQTNNISGESSFYALKRLHNQFDGGIKLEQVTDKSGNKLSYSVNKTMMRIDLNSPLKSGASISFKINWWYNINDRMQIGGRSGYEYFEEEGNYLYTIAQFFPRMAVYNEVEGWQNKQFLGRGEFALTFGDYKVSIKVPADHVVASTGTLKNADQVLTSTQRKRLEQAKSADDPVMIVNPDEALENEKEGTTKTKTWVFEAKNVRDFAFASSRKFIWDAMGVKMGNRTVLAMSYYPKEGNPLWEMYSTEVVAHTLKSYSRYSFDYPYPVAISVHTNQIGMEYPMICFNGGRPDKDGTYSLRTRNGMISVIIHEVGHNYFPMIVNSDERQWTWMDEGLNTFLQYLAEQAWEENYASRRGPPANIVDYMKGDINTITPIMTNSESIFQFGNNAYGKPATALVILRETILGRELFDFAFKEYTHRWMFKHPTPADFFRTMEDASGVDLDWFWRGWFYSTDHVDISLDEVKLFQIDTRNPEIESEKQKEITEMQPQFIGKERDLKNNNPVTTKEPKLQDFYSKLNPFSYNSLDVEEFENYYSSLDELEKQILDSKTNYYELSFSNIGGLVMPIILEFTFKDGSKEVQRIPAEIWKTNHEKISKVFLFDKLVSSIKIDPFLETADVDLFNNNWPRVVIPSRFKVYKNQQIESLNPMQRAKKASEK